MDIVEQILEEDINAGLLLWRHVISSKQVIKLDDADSNSFEFLALQEHLLQIDVFYYLQGNHLGETARSAA